MVCNLKRLPCSRMRPTLFVLISLVFAGFFARVIPHPSNFTPIIAMALAAGVFAKPRWLMVAIPFAAMFVSDLVLNNTVYAAYYEGFTWFGDFGVYLAIALLAILPVAFKANSTSSWAKLGGLGISGAVLFFLVSNFVTWFSSGMYPLSGAGLTACFAAALPFFPNTLISTLVFGAAAVFAIRGVEARTSQTSLA